MDTKQDLLKGGETGPALVPGNAEKSLLIKAVTYKDADLQMPPQGKKLSDQQISDLTQWVDRKSTRLNSSHIPLSRMPSSA